MSLLSGMRIALVVVDVWAIIILLGCLVAQTHAQSVVSKEEEARTCYVQVGMNLGSVHQAAAADAVEHFNARNTSHITSYTNCDVQLTLSRNDPQGTAHEQCATILGAPPPLSLVSTTTSTSLDVMYWITDGLPPATRTPAAARIVPTLQQRLEVTVTDLMRDVWPQRHYVAVVGGPIDGLLRNERSVGTFEQVKQLVDEPWAVQTVYIPVLEDDWESAAVRLRETGIRTVVVVTEDADTLPLWAEAVRKHLKTGPEENHRIEEYLWIFTTEPPTLKYEVDDAMAQLLEGSFYVVPHVTNTKADFTYDAVLATGLAFCKERNGGFQHLSTSLIGRTGAISFFDEDTRQLETARDSKGFAFGLFNVRRPPTPEDDDNSTAILPGIVILQPLESTLVGTHSAKNYYNLRRQDGSLARGAGAWGLDVPSHEFVYPDGTGDVPIPAIVVTNGNYLPVALQRLGAFVLLLVLAVSVLPSYVVYTRREDRFVKQSQPICIYILSVGACIVAASIPMVSMDEEKDFMSENVLDSLCGVLPWTMSVGALTMHAAMFAKLWMLRKYLPYPSYHLDHLFPVFVLCWSTVFIIVVIWQSVAKLEWERSVVQELPLETAGKCTGDYFWVFVNTLIFFSMGMMIITVVLAYQLSHFGEAVWIGRTVLFQIIVATCPILSYLMKLSNRRIGYLVFLLHVSVLSLQPVLTIVRSVLLNRQEKIVENFKFAEEGVSREEDSYNQKPDDVEIAAPPESAPKPRIRKIVRPATQRKQQVAKEAAPVQDGIMKSDTEPGKNNIEGSWSGQMLTLSSFGSFRIDSPQSVGKPAIKQAALSPSNDDIYKDDNNVTDLDRSRKLATSLPVPQLSMKNHKDADTQKKKKDVIKNDLDNLTSSLTPDELDLMAALNVPAMTLDGESDCTSVMASKFRDDLSNLSAVYKRNEPHANDDDSDGTSVCVENHQHAYKSEVSVVSAARTKASSLCSSMEDYNTDPMPLDPVGHASSGLESTSPKASSVSATERNNNNPETIKTTAPSPPPPTMIAAANNNSMKKKEKDDDDSGEEDLADIHASFEKSFAFLGNSSTVYSEALDGEVEELKKSLQDAGIC